MLRFRMLQKFSQRSQTTTQLSPASTNIFPVKKLLNTIEALANGCAHLVWFQHLSLRPSLSLHCKVWLAICIWCTFQNQNYSAGYWVLGLLFFNSWQSRGNLE